MTAEIIGIRTGGKVEFNPQDHILGKHTGGPRLLPRDNEGKHPDGTFMKAF